MKVDRHSSPSVFFFLFLFYFLRSFQRFSWEKTLKLKPANLAILLLELNLEDPLHEAPPGCFWEVWQAGAGGRGLPQFCHRWHTLDCLCPSPSQTDFNVPSNYRQVSLPSTCIIGSSSIRKSVLK